jgi:hypothetical protein
MQARGCLGVRVRPDSVYPKERDDERVPLASERVRREKEGEGGAGWAGLGLKEKEKERGRGKGKSGPGEGKRGGEAGAGGGEGGRWPVRERKGRKEIKEKNKYEKGVSVLRK